MKKLFLLLGAIIFFISINIRFSYAETFWKLIDFPIKENIEVITVDKNENIYLGTKNSGIFLSKNKGKIWENITFPKEDITSISINSKGIIFVGTAYDGIYKSQDKGKTWKKFNKGFTNFQIMDIVINSKDEIFVATVTGIYYLKNDIWVQNQNVLHNAFVNSLVIDSNDILYAGIVGGLFFSDDNTKTWKTLYIGKASVLNISKDLNDNIFAEMNEEAIYLGIPSKYIFKMNSIKLRGLVENDFKNNPCLNYLQAKEYFSSVRKYFLDKNNKKTYFLYKNNNFRLLGYKLLVTNDNCNSFENINIPSISSNMNLKKLYDNNILINDHYYSRSYYFDINKNKFIHIDEIKSNKNHYVNKLSKLPYDTFFKKDIYIFDDIKSNKNGKFFLLDYKLKRLDNNIWKILFDKKEVKKFIINSKDKIIILTGSRGYFNYNNDIFISNNNGDIWEDIKIKECEHYKDIQIDSKDNIYMLCDNNKLFFSDNNGKKWKRFNFNLNGEEILINSIAINKDNKIFIGTNKGFYKFINSKQFWEQINDGLFNKDIYSIVFDENNYIYIGTLGGIYKSSISTNLIN